MIKIEVNTNQNEISIKNEIKGKGSDLTKELYTILKHFDTNYPELMVLAVAALVNKYQEEIDG